MKQQQREQLIDEACGLRGMIAEIQVKTNFYKLNIDNFDQIEMQTTIRQMRRELATYSYRLDEIHKELSNHVVI